MTHPRWPAHRLDRLCYLEPGVDLPIFYGDLDPNGHLNNVAFGRFFEQARVMSHRAAGMSALLHEEGSKFLVARVSIDYLHEVHFGSALHVRCRVTNLGTSSIQEQQAAWQGGRCVALAEVTMVYVKDSRSAPLSPAVRLVVQRLVATGLEPST